MFFFVFFVSCKIYAQKTSICIKNINENTLIEKNINKFSQKKVNNFVNKNVLYLADNGFPFAKIVLDSVFVDSLKIKYFYRLEKGIFYIIENIFLPSENKLFPKTIYNEIGIYKNSPYNYSKIKNISNLLNNSDLYIEKMPTQIEYHNSGADIYLFLEKKCVNFVSGLLTLDYDENEKKYFPSGNFSLNLKNNFSHGENFSFVWKGYSHNSQNLNININYPYIFKTNVTSSFLLNYTKTDTTALNVNLNVGLNFKITENFNSGVSLKLKNLMPIDTSRHIYKVSANYYSSDFYFRFIKNKAKINCSSSFYLGKRKIENDKNPALGTNLFFNGKISVYQNIRLDFDYKFQLDFCKTQTSFYEKNMFGGVNYLRGFDENYFHADGFFTLQNNVRFLFSNNINLFCFYDYGYYYLMLNNYKSNDYPMSAGLGMGINSGNFNVEIFWAASRENRKFLPLYNSKINISLQLIF